MLKGLISKSLLATVALIALWGCQTKPSTQTPTPIPIPTPMPGVPTIADFTPVPGLTKNIQVRERYFKALYLWKVPEGRPFTQEDAASPVESFTKEDKKIGMHIDTTDAFVPGMLVSYRVDKRAYKGEGQEVSLTSLINKPGVYDVAFDAPKDSGGYVVRFFLNGILVENMTFEIK